MTSLELARRIVEIASDRQAEDVLLLDLRQVCTFADFFVILNAGTDRHITALCQEIDKALGQGHSLRQEGTPDSGWVLLDLGDVIVHIFTPTQRQYYQLDKLWSDATPLVRIQ